MLQFRRRRQGRGFSCRSIPALLCKEFLTSDRLAELSKDASRYHIPFEPSHMILAQAFSSDWTIALIRTSIKSRPLAEYATEHWHGHAKFENVSSHIQDGIKSLFDNDKPHFAAWLWIFDEDNGQAMSTTKPAVPLYYAALLGFRDLAEYLLSENPESTPQGWFRYNSVTRISVQGTQRCFSITNRAFPRCRCSERMGPDSTARNIVRGIWKSGNSYWIVARMWMPKITWAGRLCTWRRRVDNFCYYYSSTRQQPMPRRTTPDLSLSTSDTYDYHWSTVEWERVLRTWQNRQGV